MQLFETRRRWVRETALHPGDDARVGLKRYVEREPIVDSFVRRKATLSAVPAEGHALTNPPGARNGA